MKPVALLALNFLRQRRWPVLLMFGWIVLTAGVAGDFGRGRPAAGDVVFHAQQQSIYICIFSAFLAADAIHTERKSRRLLLVVSKAISRAEYLLAIVAASWMAAAAYAALSAMCSVWLTSRAMLPSGAVWALFVLVLAGALISATLAMFLSTFLNPYFATACTLLIFCFPIPLHAHRHSWSVWLPGFPMLVQYLRFSFGSDWAPKWITVFASLMESVALWGIAAAVFERRDIAVPVE